MAPMAEEGSSEGKRRVSASAPASCNDPPTVSMALSVCEDIATAPAPDGDDDDDDDCDCGETTNHLTEEPVLAAWTAATSPTPPGGEMTIRFFDIRSSVLCLLLLH